MPRTNSRKVLRGERRMKRWRVARFLSREERVKLFPRVSLNWLKLAATVSRILCARLAVVADATTRMELKNPGEQEYFFREFTAELDYDYALTEEVSVEVEAIS